MLPFKTLKLEKLAFVLSTATILLFADINVLIIYGNGYLWPLGENEISVLSSLAMAYA